MKEALSLTRIGTDEQASGNPASPLPRAVHDMVEGARAWELWSLLGWQDIRQRYRRSRIGPFWLTLSMAVLIAGLGTLYAGLFRQDVGEYLPYLAVGLIVWGLISTLITESCTVFIAAEGIIKQMRVPYSLHVFRTAWRNSIIFAHNFVIYLAIVPLFGVPVGPGTLLAVPGLLLLFCNVLWVGLLLGTLSTRFRDVPQIVGSVLQVVFFLTPVLWQASLLPDRAVFVWLNPIYHLIEIVRAPLLGGAAPTVSWAVAAGLAGAGWAFTLWFFGRYGRRIAYWL